MIGALDTEVKITSILNVGFLLPSSFVLSSQESAKVSDLNPNAKAWANHMFSLDPSSSADTTPAALQPWKDGCDSSADPGPEGQPAGNTSSVLGFCFMAVVVADETECKHACSSVNDPSENNALHSAVTRPRHAETPLQSFILNLV